MSDSTPACDVGNSYDGRMGLRVSSIFVIGFGSMLGALLPVFAARSKNMHIPKMAFFITKYFGSGVIIATAFIHLLAPAGDSLRNPCLQGPITEYSWVEGIALMTIFVMFFIELMASRFDIFGGHSHSHDADIEDGIAVVAMPSRAPSHSHSHSHSHSQHSPKTDRHAQPSTATAAITTVASDASSSSSADKDQEPYTDVPTRTPTYPVRDDEVSYPPGGVDHLSHQRHHSEAENFGAQMTSLFILEFGVIFHSIFIGLTLAVAGDEFVVLYIVLCFHQTFEGLGLGSRLGTAVWPKGRAWMAWALAAAYGVTTPIAIAIGLGVRKSFSPGDQKTLVVNGVFDSISAGILIYTGLVELMAHEFMFNQQMRQGSMGMVLGAFGCMCLGAGLMAVLGKWA